MARLRAALDPAHARFAAAGALDLALFLATYLGLVGTDLGQTVENLAVRGAELPSGGRRRERSVADLAASDLPAVPMGVRRAATMTGASGTSAHLFGRQEHAGELLPVQLPGRGEGRCGDLEPAPRSLAGWKRSGRPSIWQALNTA